MVRDGEGKSRLLFGAIADDLTGGAELAAMLTARGIATGCSIGPSVPIPAGNLAHVVALKSRVAPAADAVAETLAAAEALLAAGARQIFLKYCATFDSTPQGNIGPCAEALMDRLGADCALFVPALCETGRTVYQGHMFGGRQLLSESPKRHDPLTPMTDSDLVRVLARQSRRAAGLVDFAAVDAGAPAILHAIEERRAAEEALLLVDTLIERHLASIAEAAMAMPLLTGNASVAAHLPPAWLAGGWISQRDLLPARLPAVDGPAAVLAGSVADRTAEQLARFGERHPVLTLDLSHAFGGDDLMAKAAAFAERHLANGPIAIATTAPASRVEALQAAHGRHVVAARAEALLTQIARHLVEVCGVRRLVVAGGETSGAVVRGLGIAELLVGAYEGLGLSRAVASGPVPLGLFLKSGRLGTIDVFAEALEAMRRPSEQAPLLETWPPVAKGSR